LLGQIIVILEFFCAFSNFDKSQKVYSSVYIIIEILRNLQITVKLNVRIRVTNEIDWLIEAIDQERMNWLSMVHIWKD